MDKTNGIKFLNKQKSIVLILFFMFLYLGKPSQHHILIVLAGRVNRQKYL